MVNPSAAYFSAIALPIPRPPPVTTQTLPVRKSLKIFCTASHKGLTDQSGLYPACTVTYTMLKHAHLDRIGTVYVLEAARQLVACIKKYGYTCGAKQQRRSAKPCQQPHQHHSQLAWPDRGSSDPTLLVWRKAIAYEKVIRERSHVNRARKAVGQQCT